MFGFGRQKSLFTNKDWDDCVSRLVEHLSTRSNGVVVYRVVGSDVTNDEKGTTSPYGDGDKTAVRVAIDGLVEYNRQSGLQRGLMSRQTVDPVEFVDNVVTFFHEDEHVDQIRDARSHGGDQSMALQRLACLGNRSWYMLNYTHLPMEIAAEKNGFEQARKWISENCSEHFSEGQVDDMLVEVANRRIANFQGRWFFKPDGGKVNSFDEIRDGLQQALDRAASIPCKYDVRASKGDSSVLMRVTQPWLTDASPNWCAFTSLNASKTMSESLLKMASIVRFDDPDAYSDFRCLDSVDLTPETVFGFGLVHPEDMKFQSERRLPEGPADGAGMQREADEFDLGS